MIGKLLCKLPYLYRYTGSHPRSQYKGKLLSLVQQCSHVPILRDFINQQLLILSNVSAHTLTEWSAHKLHVSEVYQPHDVTYEFLNDLYGWEKPFIKDVINKIRKIKSIPAVIDIPQMLDALQVDMA